MIIFRIMEAETNITAYPSRAPEFTTILVGVRVVQRFSIFCAVPLCDVRCNFRIITIFGSSLPPVVCKSAHVIFTLFVFVYA
jgi:hypothetical protein